jgi:hypothetical protein
MWINGRADEPRGILSASQAMPLALASLIPLAE